MALGHKLALHLQSLFFAADLRNFDVLADGSTIFLKIEVKPKDFNAKPKQFRIFEAKTEYHSEALKRLQTKSP